MSSKEHSNGDHSEKDNGSHSSDRKTLSDRLKDFWSKHGVTWGGYKLMFKASLAPTIAISAYQATAWSNEFNTIGYLIGVITVLSSVMQPRAKFLQTMFIQLFLVCLSCAVSTLAFYCCVRARINSERSTSAGTGGPGTSGLAAQGAATATYNASASAVAGVWLFAMIYAISVLRAKLPQYTIPCIMVAIISNISMTYAPQFSQISQATQFILSLLKACLTAFGIATGVSLLVFPLTSRHLVRNDMKSFISGMQDALKSNLVYINSLESSDMFAFQRTDTAGEKSFKSNEAKEFERKMESLSAVLAKFSSDLPFAKREVAIGKLGPDDIQQLFRLMRECTTPATGLSCMPAIFEQTSEDAGWDRSVSFANISLAEAANDAEQARIEAIQEWHELLRLLREPFSSITDIINEGLDHVSITLELPKNSKKRSSQDHSEAAGDTPKPGDHSFAHYYHRKAEQFQQSKQLMLRGFCHVHNIELPDDFFRDPSTKNFQAPKWMNEGQFTPARRALRRQLMVVLYIEFLLYSIARRVLDLIEYADELRDSGKMSQRRLVVPGLKRVRKWVYSSLFQEQDMDAEDDADINGSSTSVRLGDAFNKRKNPEHLPPENAWERFTDQFRKIARFFESSASKFGFRVALATVTIAIVNYLENTQVFFTKERLFWAQIMASIAMSPSAGQSLRAFALRSIGTILAMALAYIAYYIVDGNTAGVLVFFFLFLHVGAYILVKYPSLAPVGIISQITITLILGYELQVKKIGIKQATSNGQAFYNVWLLGLTRLATVVGGLFVAWIFTIFPYPITEHSQFRQNLGRALYLVANYYSILHETVQLRLTGIKSDMTDKHSPGRRLEKERHKIFSKCHIILGGLRTQASFIKFDIPVGGKFPFKQYQDLLANLQEILNFMALISVASVPFTEFDSGKLQDHGYEWLTNFRKIIGEARLTSQSVTTLLSLLSSSITDGNPLPPYVRVPEPYQLSERLENLDKDILSIRHIAEPGYASFSVIQIGTKSLLDDLDKLLEGVIELVGELDFTFKMLDPSQQKEEPETLTYTMTRTNTQKLGKKD